MSSSNRILILSASVVDDLIRSIPLSLLLSNQSRVFSHHLESSSADSQCPSRVSLSTDQFTTLFMPSRHHHSTTIKCVSVPKPSVTANGIPGITLVFSDETGQVDAVVNSSNLTALRTAAGSMVATLLLLLYPIPLRRITVFGGGRQALYHALLLVKLYPSVERVEFALIRRDTPSVGTLETIQQLRAQLPVTVDIEWTTNVQASVQAADVICCCTPSTSPLFPAEWVVKDNVHLIAVGSYKPDMQELDPSLIVQASASNALVVDSVEACQQEAGDLLLSSVDSDKWIELGQIIPRDIDWDQQQQRILTHNNGALVSSSFIDGPLGCKRISLFKSVGFGLQDSAITQLVVEEALRRKVGQWVDFH